MATNFKITGAWSDYELGRKYVAKALTEKGRILAVTTISIPIDVGVDFVFYYDSEQLKTNIENGAQEQVRCLAEATPEE